MTNKQAAIDIVKRLHEAGFQGFWAGGCVRDMLLGRDAKDYDVATDARPEEVTKLFKRTVQVGAKFGVVVVVMGDAHVEVATFRTESGYADGRHPSNVAFSSAEEDAVRRDFTINGMFFDPETYEVIDHVGGQADLTRKVVRTIGDANERFGEDYLRMLRAIRFSAQLGFQIDALAWEAVCQHVGNITSISGERIATELEAMLTCSSRAKGVSLLVDCGLAEAIFPGFDADKAKFGIDVVGRMVDDIGFALGLGGLFAGCEKEFTLESCDILKLSGAYAKELKFLLDNRARLLQPNISLADFKMLLGEDGFWDLCEFQRAIQLAHGRSTRPLKAVKQWADSLTGVDLRPKPLLDGNELIALGVSAGPMVGVVAKAMYMAQLGEEIKDSAQARRWVANWLINYRRL